MFKDLVQVPALLTMSYKTGDTFVLISTLIIKKNIFQNRLLPG